MYCPFSYIGFQNPKRSHTVIFNQQSKNVGTVALKNRCYIIKRAVVTTEAPQVTIAEDTLVYNSLTGVPQGHVGGVG